MANKRNQPKPGSRRGMGEFRQFIWDNNPKIRSWWDEEQARKNPKGGQQPMKQRKANLLAVIQAKGEDGLNTNYSRIDKSALNELIKNGDVFLKRCGYHTTLRGKNHTSIIATWFPVEKEERIVEPYAKRKAALEESGLHYQGKNQGTPRQDNQKIKWNKKKDRKLLMEILAGTADKGLVNKVNRTKTKMRKINK